MTRAFLAGGASEVLEWLAPAPITGLPTVTIRHPTAGSVAVPMTVAHASVSVTTDAADPRTLTASAGMASYDGLQSWPHGECWLLQERGGAVPVTVVRVSGGAGGTIELADQLPQTPAASGPAVLQFRYWSGAIPAAATAAARDVPVTVAYSERRGNDAAALARRDEFGAHFVRQPLRTGCTTADVLTAFPQGPPSPHRRQPDYGRQIEQAHGELAAALRRMLRERVLDEHDLHDATRLRTAHAYLAVAVALQGADFEKAERFRELALGVRNPAGVRVGGMVADVVASIAVDLDRDGVVDSGEAQVPLSGHPTTHPSHFRDREDDTDTARRFTLEGGW